jgi:VanZ family protein
VRAAGKDILRSEWTDLLSIDKFVHAGVFAILVLLLVQGLRKRDGGLDLRSRAMAWWLTACVAYGGLLEIMQGAFLVDRYADVLDFLANGAGCVAAWWWLDRRARPSRA